MAGPVVAPELIVGSTGTDASFDSSDLENCMVIWAAPAIAGIEDGSCDGISAGYKYLPVVEAGVFEGKETEAYSVLVLKKKPK